MKILAIDPGTEDSGWCEYESGRVIRSGIESNDDVLLLIEQTDARACAIEMVASYGMAVGKEVFRTVWWSGRFAQHWDWVGASGPAIEIYRQDVKLHLCKSPRAKDANIRQALIDMLGPQGTKAAPGPTYGVKSHAWAALGVAVTAAYRVAAP